MRLAGCCLLLGALGAHMAAAFSVAPPSRVHLSSSRRASPLSRQARAARLSVLASDELPAADGDSDSSSGFAAGTSTLDSSVGALTQIDVCDEMQTSYLSCALRVP